LAKETLHGLLDLKNIAKLYELWCFFRVVASVRAVLGQPISAVLRKHEHVPLMEQNLERELEVAWRGGVTIAYNPAFTRANRVRRSYSVLLRPDIVLHVPDGPSQGYHLFDAKFRLAHIPTDLADADSDDEESDGRSTTFKTADLHKMHAYREAIAGTRSVRILYPGSVSKFFDADGEADAEAIPGIDGVGAIPAVPHTDTQAHQPLMTAIRTTLAHLLAGNV
jgi:predicted component of viral defense system (DUF524 family)